MDERVTMTTKRTPAGANGGQGDGRAGLSSTRILSRDGPGVKGTYHLARLLAGAADADVTAIRAAWEDIPLNGGKPDLARVRAWLAERPELAGDVARIDPNAPEPTEHGPLSLLSADDILTTEWPEPVWAIPDILPVGLSILAGKPKVGKSWLALQLAQAVAAGGQALGRRVERGPALYLALEDPPRRLKDRMRLQGWPPGLPVDFMPMGHFIDEVGDLRNGGGEVLARQIAARRYRLAVIDTLSRSVGGDQMDVGDMTLALGPLAEIAHAFNCAVVLLDHHNKTNSGDAISDILGSTAKAAVCDTALGLYKEQGKAGARLTVIGRDVAEQSLALSFDGLTRCWQCDGDADALELTENRQAILDAIGGMGSAGLVDIADAVERNKGSVYRDLQDLLSAGLALKHGNRYEVA